MTRSRSLFAFAMILLLVISLHNRSINPLAQTQSGPSYSLTVLSEFFSPAMDIDDAGKVVGYHQMPTASGTSRGYTWTASAGLQPLLATAPEIDRFPAYPSPLRVNSFGTVAGAGSPFGIGIGSSQAAFYSPVDGLQFLIHEQYGTNGIGSGTVVGNLCCSGAPFIYTSPEALRFIPGFHPASNAGNASDVNDAGQVVGNCVGDVATGSEPGEVAHCFTSSAGSTTAFLWSQAGGFSLLPKFGTDEQTFAMAITGLGEIVGRSADGNGVGPHRVFKWSFAGGLVDLQAPEGYPEYLDINDSGQIIATIIVGSIGRVPYLYESGTWYNLNDLIPAGSGFTLQFARRISNSGQIVGEGSNAPGLPHTELGIGYVMTPAQTSSNHAPVLASIGNKSVNEQSMLAFTVTATDADAGDTLTFSVDPGAPAGAAITSSGFFSWTPTEAQGPGSYPITIRANDNGSPSLSDSETITIQVNEVNSPPVLAAIGNKTIKQGSTLTFTASAADPDVPNNTLSFSLDAGAPDGATIQPASGDFNWTPLEW